MRQHAVSSCSSRRNFHDITAAIAFCRTFFPWYLVQHRTSPWRDRHAHPGRRPSQSNPERAGAARADPSSRLDPSSRTLRSRDPTTGSPSPSRLDQPTCDTHNRRNCSVNRNRHCLKVVDRFRGGFLTAITQTPKGHSAMVFVRSAGDEAHCFRRRGDGSAGSSGLVQDTELRLRLVAGVGFEPTTFRL